MDGYDLMTQQIQYTDASKGDFLKNAFTTSINNDEIVRMGLQVHLEFSVNPIVWFGPKHEDHLSISDESVVLMSFIIITQ